MKKKDSKNYLDFIPEKNPEIEYETGEDGIITVLIEWKGFYHKLAQRFFHRPRVSEIKLDKLGTFVWNSIDDKKDVHAISKELEAEFPSMEQPLTRLIKYLEILHDNHLIYWKERNGNDAYDSEISSLCTALCSCYNDCLRMGIVAYDETGKRSC